MRYNQILIFIVLLSSSFSFYVVRGVIQVVRDSNTGDSTSLPNGKCVSINYILVSWGIVDPTQGIISPPMVPSAINIYTLFRNSSHTSYKIVIDDTSVITQTTLLFVIADSSGTTGQSLNYTITTYRCKDNFIINPLIIEYLKSSLDPNGFDFGFTIQSSYNNSSIRYYKFPFNTTSPTPSLQFSYDRINLNGPISNQNQKRFIGTLIGKHNINGMYNPLNIILSNSTQSFILSTINPPYLKRSKVSNVGSISYYLPSRLYYPLRDVSVYTYFNVTDSDKSKLLYETSNVPPQLVYGTSTLATYSSSWRVQGSLTDNIIQIDNTTTSYSLYYNLIPNQPTINETITILPDLIDDSYRLLQFTYTITTMPVDELIVTESQWSSSPSLKYPFGYSNSQTQTVYSYIFTIGAPLWTYKLNVTVGSLTQSYMFGTSQLPTYQLSNINIQLASVDSVIVSMHIVTDPTIYNQILNYIVYNGVGYRASLALTNGTINNGQFIFQHNQTISNINLIDPPTLTLLTTSPDSFDFDSRAININLDSLPFEPIHPFFELEPFNITYFKFIPNGLIDTSLGDTKVTLIFNVSDRSFDKSYRSQFTVYFSDPGSGMNNDIVSDISYSFNDGMYRTDFILPARLHNASLQYQIGSNLFKNDIPLNFNSQLNVFSNFTDRLPPFITNINVYPNQSIQIQSIDMIIGFSITISDIGNGFNKGRVGLVSNGNPMVWWYNLNDTNRIGGDQQIGVYNIPINIASDNRCVPQTYTIKYVELQDNSGWKSATPFTSTTQFNPLQYFTSTTNYSVSYTCALSTVDLIQPTIQSLTITLINNTGELVNTWSSNRTIQFDLVTYDNREISIDHEPVIYVSGSNIEDIVSTNGALIKALDITKKVGIFRYLLQLPLGFAAQESVLILSVFGVTDITLNTNPYDTVTLKGASLPYFINVSSNPSPIVITSSSKLNRFGSGGVVTISGRQLSLPLTAYVDYNDSKGYITQPVLYGYSVTAAISLTNNLTTINSTKIKVCSTVSLKCSNEYIVNVVDDLDAVLRPDAPTPPTCQTTGCNGHGVCGYYGCVCSDHWFGPSCSSVVIIVDPPIVNGTDPTVIIHPPTDDGSGHGNGTDGVPVMTSIISIRSIRELDMEGLSIRESFFDSWTFTNQTNVTAMPLMYSYFYSSILKDLGTSVNVTMNWYTATTNISFANDIIQVSESSLKINISVGQYPFQQALNTMQVVVEVQVSSPFDQENQDQQTICTTTQTNLGGDGLGGVEWIKMRLNNQVLYGRFIRRGIADGRPIFIRNQIIHDILKPQPDTLASSDTFIGINVPYYQYLIQIDPDFSHILDTGDDDNDGGGYSYGTCRSIVKKGILSSGGIVGIVVGGLFLIAISIGLYMYIKKKKEYLKASNETKLKLAKLND